MPTLYCFIVTLRFDCPSCGQKSEQEGALTINQDSDDAIRQAVYAAVPKCQQCGAPIAPDTELNLTARLATADQLADLGLPTLGGI